MTFSETHPSIAASGRFQAVGLFPHRWLVAKHKNAIRARQLFAAVVAVWLVIQMFDVLITIGGSYELALTVCVFWIVVPLFFAAPQSFLKTGLVALTASRGKPSVLLLSFLSASLLSALLSGDTTKSVAYLLATVLTLVLEYELCACLGAYFYSALRWYSIMGSIAYLPFYVRGAVAGTNWGRLSVSEGDHPNHFGLVCFSILGAAFAWRSWPVRLTISALMIAMIAAAESRSSLVSALVMMAVFMALELKKRKAVVTAILAAGLMCVAFVVSFEQITGAISSALNLEDRHRGVTSGLSGRVDLWQAGEEIFLDHPILGVGFRLQDQALPARFKYAGAVHNGFLGTLVEVGLLGAIPLFWFMAIGIRKLWRESRLAYPASQLGFSYVIGYCASSMVEPRLLNLAHPASVIAWCFLIGGGIRAQLSTNPRVHSRSSGFRKATPNRVSPIVEPRPRDWRLLLKHSREHFSESDYRS